MYAFLGNNIHLMRAPMFHEDIIEITHRRQHHVVVYKIFT